MEARDLIAANLSRFPDHKESLFYQALLRFYMEESWFEAWKGLEHRWAAGIRFKRPAPEGRQWTGSSLHGSVVLLAGEGGFGDQIQYIRFAPALKAAGARRIVVTVRHELVALLGKSPGVDEIVPSTRDGLVPEEIRYDVAVPMLSAPHLLRLSKQQLLGSSPYIEAKPLDLAGSGRPRVGVHWRSAWLARSIRPELFNPLTDNLPLSFFGLGKYEDTEEAKAALPIPMLGAHDLVYAARAIAAMDLIVTVDTMAAHLAGALGKPVWILLPYVPDWKWGIDGDTTPWYQTAKLFRQGADKSWIPVIQKVRSELIKRFGI